MAFDSEIFGISPYPELLARKLYYKYLRNTNLLNKGKSVKQSKNKKKDENFKVIPLEDLIQHLRKLGIKNDDLLVVHSSAEGLKRLAANELDILDSMINLVGEKGTVALPAFPNEETLKDQDGIKIYDPKRSVAWTGMLPNLLLRKKGAVRSEFPYNPLVAIGKNASDMMVHNLDTDLAHDEKSCWGYCIEHHAKILFLGLPAYHSCTVLHVVEDYHPDYWPNGWYEDLDYYVKTPHGTHLKRVRVRKIEWAQFMAERYTEQKYIKSGLIKVADYNGITIRYINDCNSFVNTIWNDWEKLKFFYLPK